MATNRSKPSAISEVQPQALNEADAARYLGGVSTSYLRAARIGRGEGPPFVRVGSRSVRYLISDLNFWLESRVVGRKAAR